MAHRMNVYSPASYRSLLDFRECQPDCVPSVKLIPGTETSTACSMLLCVRTASLLWALSEGVRCQGVVQRSICDKGPAPAAPVSERPHSSVRHQDGSLNEGLAIRTSLPERQEVRNFSRGLHQCGSQTAEVGLREALLLSEVGRQTQKGSVCSAVGPVFMVAAAAELDTLVSGY